MTSGAPIPLRGKASAVAPPGLWRVRLTVAGEPLAEGGVAEALLRLCDLSPFMASVRYDHRHAEVTYWDEADDLSDVAAMALRMWNDNRREAGLPDWAPIGLEVLDRDTLVVFGSHGPLSTSTGQIRHF